MSYTNAVKAFVTKAAPNFHGVAYCPKHKHFENISLEKYKNKYLLLFFYPLDFTFVCPTEIIQFSNNVKKFNDLNCEILGCSVDSQFTHMAYVQRPRDQGGLGEKLHVKLLSDTTQNISRDYGVLVDGGVSLRGTFIIDPKQIIRHSSINDFPVGRNVEEYLRLLQAFQHVDHHGDVCPASWVPGKETLDASHSSGNTSKYWKNVHAHAKK